MGLHKGRGLVQLRCPRHEAHPVLRGPSNPGTQVSTSTALLLVAGIGAVLGPGKGVVDVDQREHGQGAGERAGLDGDATPQQGGVASLMEQGANDHLHIGEDASEANPGEDLHRDKGPA